MPLIAPPMWQTSSLFYMAVGFRRACIISAAFNVAPLSMAATNCTPMNRPWPRSRPSEDGRSGRRAGARQGMRWHGRRTSGL